MSSSQLLDVVEIRFSRLSFSKRLLISLIASKAIVGLYFSTPFEGFGKLMLNVFRTAWSQPGQVVKNVQQI